LRKFTTVTCKKENRAVARKQRDAAAVLFGLKFAGNIHYKFKSSHASKARLQSTKYRRKTEFNAKSPFKVIRGHMFLSQWKGDRGLSNTIIIMLAYLLRFQRYSARNFSSSKDPQSFRRSQIFCGSRSTFVCLCCNVIQRKYSINSLYNKYVK